MNISKLSISGISCKAYRNIRPARDVFPKTAEEEAKNRANIAKVEKRYQKIEYMMRVIANRFMDLFEPRQQKELTQKLSEIKPESNDTYLIQNEIVSRIFCYKDRVIDVNIEDKILEKAAQNGGSHIFIMNHSSQKRDPSMLAVVSTLLSMAYRQEGKSNNFPLPKIILNQDILKTMHPRRRRAFEACGAVGVDANIFCADKKVNAQALFPIMKDFVRDKVNIFIFPEGKLSVFKDMEFDNRFQIGIAELINKVLNIKKEIKVIPLGFAYGKGKNKLTGIQIGHPVVFKREGENTTSTSGSILKSDFGKEAFKNFFEKHKNETDAIITENGVPVKPTDAPAFIKGILAENLDICSKEAQKRIETPFNSSEVIIV